VGVGTNVQYSRLASAVASVISASPLLQFEIGRFAPTFKARPSINGFPFNFVAPVRFIVVSFCHSSING